MKNRPVADVRHAALSWQVHRVGPWPFTMTDMLPVLCLSLLIFNVFVGFWPVFISGDYGLGELLAGSGDSVRQVSFAMLFLLIIASSVYTSGLASLLNVPTPLLALLAWCCASVAWAVDPEVSFRRVLFTGMVVLSVTYSTNMLSQRGVISILCAAFVAILAADWLAIPLLTQAVHQPGELDPALVGNWRGIHSHKNEAGAFCALASIVFVNLIIEGRSTIVGPVLTTASLGFLYMTMSKTSGGFVVAAMLLSVVIIYCYRNPTLRLTLFVAVLSASLLGLTAFGDRTTDLVSLFEDPSSLTGRVQIWPVLLRYASGHLLLGSGYGSFWAIGDTSPILEFGTGWLTSITHAHNGYLDVLVQTGLVGLTLSITGLVLAPLRILLTRPLTASRSRWLLGAILTFCWLHNLLETSLLDRANIVWVTMLIFYNLLQREPSDARA